MSDRELGLVLPPCSLLVLSFCGSQVRGLHLVWGMISCVWCFWYDWICPCVHVLLIWSSWHRQMICLCLMVGTGQTVAICLYKLGAVILRWHLYSEQSVTRQTASLWNGASQRYARPGHCCPVPHGVTQSGAWPAVHRDTGSSPIRKLIRKLGLADQLPQG